MNHSFEMKKLSGKLISCVLLGSHPKVYFNQALPFTFILFTLCLLLLKLLKFLMHLLVLTIQFNYAGHSLFDILVGRSGGCLLLLTSVTDIKMGFRSQEKPLQDPLFSPSLFLRGIRLHLEVLYPFFSERHDANSSMIHLLRKGQAAFRPGKQSSCFSPAGVNSSSTRCRKERVGYHPISLLLNVYGLCNMQSSLIWFSGPIHSAPYSYFKLKYFDCRVSKAAQGE